MKPRDGSALLEVMTTAALLALLGTIAATLLHSEALVMRNTSDHIAIDVALNSALAIVAGELRHTASPDVRAIARDSIALRVFRGRGIVCSRGAGTVHVRYRGLREPNPDKDSVLNIRLEAGDLFRSSLERKRSCPLENSETEIAVTTGLPLENGDVLLFFESGSYYLATNALRYRRGLEGKQPLTDEQVDDRASLFARDTDRGLRLLIRAKSPAATEADVRLRFLNQP